LRADNGICGHDKIGDYSMIKGVITVAVILLLVAAGKWELRKEGAANISVDGEDSPRPRWLQ
jgi:hypothetical protein